MSDLRLVDLAKKYPNMKWILLRNQKRDLQKKMITALTVTNEQNPA